MNILNIDSSKVDCSDLCFNKSANFKLDLYGHQCLMHCNESEHRLFEHNNFCDETCPDNTYPLFDNYEYYCVEKIPSFGYYLDTNDDNIYKKCYETCKYCHGKGN